jgi:molybdopterin converting factor subunit 1
MNVTILFFAQARERAGRSRADLDLPDGARVADLPERLAREFPGVAPLLPTLALAVDGEVAPADRRLTAGAEVALLPPVSGG